MSAIHPMTDAPEPDPVEADRLLNQAIRASKAGRGADVADYFASARAVYPLPAGEVGGTHLQAAREAAATSAQFRTHCERARTEIERLVTIMEDTQ